MDTLSPWPTPESTPPRVSIVDCLTPCSENSLRGSRITFEFQQSPSVVASGTQRRRLRSIIFLSWMTALMLAFIWWVLDGDRQSILFENDIGLSSKPPALGGLQFLDATHPYIRYVGRWASTPDRTQKDGSFPGVYFEFAFSGSNTILLSLHNTDPLVLSPISKAAPALAVLPTTNISHSEPISLLARVDDDEYIILPNASSIVMIRRRNLDMHSRHEVRIIAPMVENRVETLEIEGLWIDEGGQLLPFEDVLLTGESTVVEVAKLASPKDSHKMLEIVTDLLGSMAGRDRRKNASKTRGILGGVMGWEYLLGDMFGADHVMVGMDGMCLIQECIGGRGSPAGLADVFFQSGPLGSAQYSQPWLFEGYVPDVMIMNIGNADWESFQMYGDQYNKTLWELSILFEETYVSLIRAIRTLAYPKHSSSVSSQSMNAATFPIFIMRPFRGQLEQMTHSVVDRLRLKGDSSVFWLDTSGWLDTDVDFNGPADDQDFFLDDVGPSKHWRLTERGNQRVAILLHMHVCRYLARDPEKCAFLPAEVYQGTIDPEEMGLNELQEDDGGWRKD